MLAYRHLCRCFLSAFLWKLALSGHAAFAYVVPFDNYNQTLDSQSYGFVPYQMSLNNFSQQGLPPALGHWVVGNGGDRLRLLLNESKEHASIMVAKINSDILQMADPDIRDFLTGHQQELAADILASPHIWTAEEKGSCAWTRAGEGPVYAPQPVEFSYPTCRHSIDNYRDAALLLIHESAHHFQKDEDFADRLAIFTVTAWQSGQLQWQELTSEEAPSARMMHAAVYCGDGMLVFGGWDGEAALADGGRYFPKTKTWQKFSPLEVRGRYHLDGVCFQDRFVVFWGGFERDADGKVGWQNDGWMVDLEDFSWVKIKAPWPNKLESHLEFAPVQSLNVSEKNVTIFGGRDENGKTMFLSFNPEKKEWQRLPSEDAPQTLGGHTSVRTEKHLLVFGGYEGLDVWNRELSEQGSVYDFTTGLWKKMSSANAPAPRYGHQSVWTGNAMFTFGGQPTQRGRQNRVLHGTGGLYFPQEDLWIPLEAQSAPERSGHTVVWNGHEVLIMGGKSRYMQTYYSDVVAYNVELNQWRSVGSMRAPSLRWHHSAVSTSTAMIIWGGGIGLNEPAQTGAVFYP